MAREIEEALRVFELSLPVMPAEIKRRYRALAMAHHPDRNTSNPGAGEKMKAVNKAFEVLTGVESEHAQFRGLRCYLFRSHCSRSCRRVRGVPNRDDRDRGYTSGLGLRRELRRRRLRFRGDILRQVILLSREGQPLVVYDIGTCPTEIVDLGRYAYFLTNTRLYIVEDRRSSRALLNVFQQGRLLVPDQVSGYSPTRSSNGSRFRGRKWANCRPVIPSDWFTR